MQYSTFARLASATVCFFSLGAVAFADDSEQLENIVVTATRTAMDIDAVLAPMLVINRDEIERSGATDVAQILRFHAGFDIGRNGGPGQTTSLFLRGAESNHTLVLVDGVRINPGTIGGAALQNISPTVIERIEVVKGPRSTLYGTEAMGGVINIITRTGDTRALSMDGAISAGDYGSRSLAANLALSGEAGQLGASVSHLATEGFPTLAGSTIDRAHRNTTAKVHGATRLGEVDLQASHWQATGEAEFLDFFGAPKEQNFTNAATSVSLGLDPVAKWSTRLALSHAVDDIEQGAAADFVKTNRQVIDWQNTVDLSAGNTLIAGATLTNDDVTSLVFGLPTDEKTRTMEVYAEDIVELGAHQWLIAGRYTDHETFGDHLNANVEYGYSMTDATRITVGAGTGYRAPDATDLYGFGGNRALKPEKSTNIEVGVRHRISNQQSLTAGLFSNTIDDLIEYNFDPVTFGGQNENIDEARINGVELGYDLAGELWSFRTSAIVQDPENRSTGDVLPRRSRRSLTASVHRRFADRFGIGLDLLATDRRKDSGFSSTVNAGYVLANLNGHMDINPQWRLHGKVENLLDANYQTAAGFNTPGRGMYLTLRFRN